MPDINSLSYLIPTGDKDIAVREILVKFFGDAIACKIPLPAGSVPICNTLNSTDAAVTNGELVATIFGVFNAGTLVFATILLIFIGLMVFVRTAQGGVTDAINSAGHTKSGNDVAADFGGKVKQRQAKKSNETDSLPGLTVLPA